MSHRAVESREAPVSISIWATTDGTQSDLWPHSTGPGGAHIQSSAVR